MKFLTFLKKHFDVEVQEERREKVTYLQYWVYDKDNDCEPACILEIEKHKFVEYLPNTWVLRNIFFCSASCTVSEDMFKTLLRERK